jgi:hypothetical protein
MFSFLLKDYLDPGLSEKAIPICIKLLQHHNIKPDLLKEICSYLNLIACRSSELLTDYVYYILNAIVKGHTSLTQLLYQVCESHPECIYPLVKHLVKALRVIEPSSDLAYILQIMYLVSLNHVHVSNFHYLNQLTYSLITKYFLLIKIACYCSLGRSDQPGRSGHDRRGVSGQFA